MTLVIILGIALLACLGGAALLLHWVFTSPE
jgi:hypothetical protein